MELAKQPNKTFKIVATNSIFITTLLVFFTTVCGMSLFGLMYHKTVFEISILSISTLAIILFLFLNLGLYFGFKLKDNFKRSYGDISSNVGLITPSVELSQDIFASVALWLVLFIGSILLTVIIDVVVWPLIIASLYWIFYRALRLVFKNSGICKGNFSRSTMYAAFYTFCYTAWIYGIIFITHFLLKIPVQNLIS